MVMSDSFSLFGMGPHTSITSMSFFTNFESRVDEYQYSRHSNLNFTHHIVIHFSFFLA